jgi:sugar-specific transcriptional regulator TrmB
MNDKIFEQLGLSHREVILYRTLLTLGPSSIRNIAEQAGINRGTAYECLKEMQLKGIVTYLPKGKRRYFAP